MMRNRKWRNWIFPISLSLLLHLCLVTALFSQQAEKPSQEPKLTLVMREAPAQAKSAAPPPLTSETRPPVTEAPKPKPRAPARKPEQAVKTEPPAKTAAKEAPQPAAGAPDETGSEAGGSGTPSESVSETGGGDRTHPSQSGPGDSPPVPVNTLNIAKKVIPEYPSFSRKRNEEGRSVVIVTIKNGVVTRAEIRESSGYKRLDNSALQAAKQWKFHQEKEIRAILPFVFRLDD